MDVGTGLALLGSVKLLEKLLGPTAEYIGEGLKTWTEKRINNVGRIFSIAERKLGDRIEAEGSVPPKVLKRILDEGSFCDDAVTAEYFGGVLASSRSEISRDDRGAYFIALIGRLSTYQIRAHYVFYRIIRNLFRGTVINVGTDHLKMQTFIPYHVFVLAMEFIPQENREVLLPHIMFGLRKESLIEQSFRMGSAEHIRDMYDPAMKSGIIFEPSGLGVELFLWAHGEPDVAIHEFLTTEKNLDSSVGVTIPLGYESTKDTNKTERMATTGRKPGIGTYSCTACGQTVHLDDDSDTLPPCPSCAGTEYRP